jgi:hypothetical protein
LSPSLTRGPSVSLWSPLERICAGQTPSDPGSLKLAWPPRPGLRPGPGDQPPSVRSRLSWRLGRPFRGPLRRICGPLGAALAPGVAAAVRPRIAGAFEAPAVGHRQVARCALLWSAHALARQRGDTGSPSGLDTGHYSRSTRLCATGRVHVRHGVPTSGRLLLVVLGNPFPTSRGETFARWAGRLRILAAGLPARFLLDTEIGKHRPYDGVRPGVSGGPESQLDPAGGIRPDRGKIRKRQPLLETFSQSYPQAPVDN